MLRTPHPVNSDDNLPFATLQDVRLLSANFTTLVVRSNKGYLWPLLDNTHHKVTPLLQHLQNHQTMSRMT